MAVAIATENGTGVNSSQEGNNIGELTKRCRLSKSCAYIAALKEDIEISPLVVVWLRIVVCSSGNTQRTKYQVES